MNLEKEKWKPVEFGEVVTHIEENEKDETIRKCDGLIKVE